MEIAAQLKDATTQREFAELLERNRGLVFKVANGYGRDAEDRADLAQEIAAQLWRAWPAYDPSRPLATWMYRIALNVAISHLRGRSRHDAHHVPLDESHEAIEGAADAVVEAYAAEGCSLAVRGLGDWTVLVLEQPTLS